MADNISLMSQTTYAELLDRVRASAFSDDFPKNDGVFVAKTTRGRVYWYFQESSARGRGQKYVGPETEDLRERIAAHNAARTYRRDQRSLVATLVRSGNLPSPRRDIGELIAALAAAGVFRLRGVLVGTVAYQTYSPLLGVRLPAALVQTGDVDLAQDATVSAEVADATLVSDVLRQVDISFRPVPRINSARVVSYRAASGLRVDFLTSNRGPDTDEPRTLPAFGVDAQPLRFLDFLIRDPEPAVLLHGTGVLVSVPAPQRFALHKLIVARRRHEDRGKRQKDLMQAGALLDALVEKRPHELRAAWDEAFGRGKNWRRLIGEGLGLLHPAIRDRVLRTVGTTRQIVPGLELHFAPSGAKYDPAVDGVRFFASGSGPISVNESIPCVVTRELLSAMLDGRTLDPGQCLEAFRSRRAEVERMARTTYLEGPVQLSRELMVAGVDDVS